MKIAISHANAAYMMGGSVVYVWALARYLCQQGHDARIIAGTTPNPIHIFPELAVELFPFRRRERFPKLGTRFRKLMERCSFGWNSRHYLTAEKFDVLNVHKPYDFPLAAWVKRQSGCRIVWRCHGPDFYPGLRFFLPHVDEIYCVSQVAQNNLLSFYPKLRTQVIYTGVDTDFFAPPTKAPETSHRPPVVLYFGRLEGWKGVTHLVHALEILRNETFQGRIVGEGPDAGRVKELIHQFGLESKVSLEPSVRTREAVRDLLAEADIVAFTAVAEETMSNAMLEAMSMAKAIVATRIGCFPEVLVHEKNALLVEPRSPQKLADGIRALLSSSGRRQTLGQAARSAAVEGFDAEKSFRKVEQLFANLSPTR